MQTSNPFTNYSTKKSANFSWINIIFRVFKDACFLPESREKGGNEHYECKELVHFSQISDHFFTDFFRNIGGLSSLCFLKLVSVPRLEITLFHGFLHFPRFKCKYWYWNAFKDCPAILCLLSRGFFTKIVEDYLAPKRHTFLSEKYLNLDIF